MIDITEVLPMILFIVLIILVIICIVLGIKLIGTLNKVDVIIDDVNTKMNKVDGIFNIIDRTTDYASGLSDKIINGLTNLVGLIFKHKDKEDVTEFEEGKESEENEKEEGNN